MLTVGSSAGIGLPNVGSLFSVERHRHGDVQHDAPGSGLHDPDAFLPLLEPGRPDDDRRSSAPRRASTAQRNPNAPAGGEIYVKAIVQAELTIGGVITLDRLHPDHGRRRRRHRRVPRGRRRRRHADPVPRLAHRHAQPARLRRGDRDRRRRPRLPDPLGQRASSRASASAASSCSRSTRSATAQDDPDVQDRRRGPLGTGRSSTASSATAPATSSSPRETIDGRRRVQPRAGRRPDRRRRDDHRGDEVQAPARRAQPGHRAARQRQLVAARRLGSDSSTAASAINSQGLVARFERVARRDVRQQRRPQVSAHRAARAQHHRSRRRRSAASTVAAGFRLRARRQRLHQRLHVSFAKINGFLDIAISDRLAPGVRGPRSSSSARSCSSVAAASASSRTGITLDLAVRLRPRICSAIFDLEMSGRLQARHAAGLAGSSAGQLSGKLSLFGVLNLSGGLKIVVSPDKWSISIPSTNTARCVARRPAQPLRLGTIDSTGLVDITVTRRHQARRRQHRQPQRHRDRARQPEPGDRQVFFASIGGSVSA